MAMYEWKDIGSAAEQERCMREACFLGPWSLEIVESGWFEMMPDEQVAVWDVHIYQWNQGEMEYKIVFETKTSFTNRDLAKSHAEDWYACNVLFDKVVLGEDSGHVE